MIQGFSIHPGAGFVCKCQPRANLMVDDFRVSRWRADATLGSIKKIMRRSINRARSTDSHK